MTRRNPRVAIVGAGMSGICLGITLQRAGFHNFTIFEKADRLGGTWRENTYPGLACDVPSRFYQYSFAKNPDWSHVCSPGGEINEYFTRVARDHGLDAYMRFGTEVVDARFVDGAWEVTTSTDEVGMFDFVVCVTGVLHRPRTPAIAGLDSFAGHAFHSARWDHNVELTGKRVGVIGTGSTGAQIVTALAGNVAQLSMFQRTPQWIFPLPNPRYSALTKALHRRIPLLDTVGYRLVREVLDLIFGATVSPGWQRDLISQICRVNLRTVRDPKLRQALTPDYEPMCKRLIFSSGFYGAIQRDGVDLVTAGIDRVEPRGIVTADGRLHELDVLVLATGFDAHAFMRPMAVTGRDGLTVERAWADGPKAHLGITMPGFPNLFMMMGPHSPFGNYSLTAMAENQADHILGWLRRWCEGEFDTVEPTAETTDRFNQEMRDAMPNTVWATGCQSWYLGADGLPELWPWTPRRYTEMMLADPDPAEYRFDRRVTASPTGAP